METERERDKETKKETKKPINTYIEDTNAGEPQPSNLGGAKS